MLRDKSFGFTRERADKVLERAAEAGRAAPGRGHVAARDADIAFDRKVSWPAVDTLKRAP